MYVSTTSPASFCIAPARNTSTHSPHTHWETTTTHCFSPLYFRLDDIKRQRGQRQFRACAVRNTPTWNRTVHRMDLHRLRFIHCQPQAIHCLAFSTAHVPRPKLAVSRGDASIEIWLSVDGESYYKDWTVPGRTDTSIEALLWCGHKLYSAGLTGECS